MNSRKNNYKVVYWEKAFSTGNGKIDNGNKRFFEIANDLDKYKNDSKMIIKILKELVLFAKTHYKSEEDFMSLTSYSDLNVHKLLHKDILYKLNNLIKYINTKDLDELVSRLTILLHKDILPHILFEDKKIYHANKSREQLKECFKWKDDYTIGSKLLDLEHKTLFSLALKAISYNDLNMKNHLKKTISELYDFMKTHFTHEEEFMREINYPGLHNHIMQHENIIKQVNDFIKTLPTLKMIDFERKLIEYMDVWIVNHIIYEDKKIFKFKNA